jgi:DNA topoisomerase VI subunit A
MNETGVDWDVTFDARGHFNEPHGGKSFGFGTLEVRAYLAGFNEPSLIEAGISGAAIETYGPTGNFDAVLFIEKEGFDPFLKAARIAERFDVATMSTKGMSVTAARQLADQMCDEYDIPLLLLHDFDKAGFSIAGTLQRDTRRYESQNAITIIDLGLGLANVIPLGLEHEYQHHGKEQLTEAYKLFTRSHMVEQMIERELKKSNGNASDSVPRDIEKRVRDYLVNHPDQRWDAAVEHIAKSSAKTRAQ